MNTHLLTYDRFTSMWYEFSYDIWRVLSSLWLTYHMIWNLLLAYHMFWNRNEYANTSYLDAPVPPHFPIPRCEHRKEAHIKQSRHLSTIVCDILTQGLIRLIEYWYHQGIPSFLKSHLQRTPTGSNFWMSDRSGSFLGCAQVRTKVHKKTRVGLWGYSMILGNCQK